MNRDRGERRDDPSGPTSGVLTTVGTTKRSAILMDTLVSIEVVDHELGAWDEPIERAFGWFRQVEAACSRFNPESEVMRLVAQAGKPVPAGPILFEAVRFALEVARVSGGAFDPTIGYALEQRGFNRDYRTGRRVSSSVPDGAASWRDVELVYASQSIVLRRPLVLDLGAMVKGMAVDLAARELAAAPGFAIDAGGDLFVHGLNALGKRWRIGIRHPRAAGQLLGTVDVSDVAVCTSGDYERVAEGVEGHHILDPRSTESATAVASVTTIGRTAMAADALGTAAFVLGPVKGTRFLEKQGMAGFVVTPSLRERATRDFIEEFRWQRSP